VGPDFEGRPFAVASDIGVVLTVTCWYCQRTFEVHPETDVVQDRTVYVYHIPEHTP
jgi:hypothetical protein